MTDLIVPILYGPGWPFIRKRILLFMLPWFQLVAENHIYIFAHGLLSCLTGDVVV